VDKYLKQNQTHWDEVTPIHEKSSSYDVTGFKAGRCTIRPIELEEVGVVAGKSLLHLQCHFGMDTLSWGRRGAKVTGVDFSGEAIKLARRLSKETGIAADFIESDIYKLPEIHREKYDIVFTSWGVLSWIPDLKKWAQVVNYFLKKGGVFYIMEFHPITLIYDDAPNATRPEIILSYFQGKDPLQFLASPDYASGIVPESGTYQWQYPLGEVVTALVEAGLRIEFLHEFPVSCYKALPYMKKSDDGWWRIEGNPFPLTFSIKASKT
jgi:SAM-dependent methyltransferase